MLAQLNFVANPYAESLRCSRRHFKHIAGQSRRNDEILGKGLCVHGDVSDSAAGVKNNMSSDIKVFFIHMLMERGGL